jgi:hypothetical protein
MANLINLEQHGKQFKNSCANFLNIQITALTWTLATFICFIFLKSHLGGNRFPDGEKTETEVRKWLQQ